MVDFDSEALVSAFSKRETIGTLGVSLNQYSAAPIAPESQELIMAKPHRPLKKSNHGKRPANAKNRRAKRKLVRT